MAVSDAIIIGESWISEHFFTSDSTKESFQAKVHEREKLWKQQKADGLETTLSRFEHVMPELAAVFGTLSEHDDGVGDAMVTTSQTLVELYTQLRRVLGYEAGGMTQHRRGSARLIGTEGIDGAPLAVVDARPARSAEDIIRRDAPDAPVENLLLPTTLPETGPLTGEAQEGERTLEFTNVARLLSELFVRESGPQFALVFAGGWALVAERERWAEGRYLAINLQLVVERNERGTGKELDRAVTCLDAASLAPDPDGDIWWSEVLEESVRHTVGVSDELRDGVREAIEIIANDVVRQRRVKGLEPLPDNDAQPLAKQSLRFLYRILFLLYAEASPELGVLPVGAPEYESGYSLDRLRDLTLVPLTSERSRQGRHLYESLNRLFTLVDRGNAAKQPLGQVPVDAGEGLHFEALRSDLFQADRTALIDEIGLSNEALQQVLDRLLLTRSKKAGRGKRAERGFISYAELGINQLGAVYEGLMSYTGFFAEEPLYEVARNGNPEKGSWVIPASRVEALEGSEKALISESLVRVSDAQGQSVPRRYEPGQFVFRLAGRERQQSASYYSPEVLTKFTVSQALSELLDQGGELTPARDILQMTVCEPALGSGAFAIEAVRQLAAAYLSHRQQELDQAIDPDEYPRELQKVKAYIALHQTYGVDLNATAVELAEISLWLDTMVSGLQAPWFGLHLRRGNSLIGARHAFYSTAEVKNRSWLKHLPEALPLTQKPQTGGKIPHFLLPASGWGSAVDAKAAKELAPGTLKALKAWRRTITAKPSKTEIDRLVSLGYRVEALWQLALRRLQLAESQIRRSVDVWGAEDPRVGGGVSREEIERALADSDGAYRRLRTVMDAWCALWYWPLAVEGSEWPQPPTYDEWLTTLEEILGKDYERSKTVRRMNDTQVMLTLSRDWDALGDAEQLDLGYASVHSMHEVENAHPWLNVTQDIARQQGFFHWELDFAKVFAAGGFDLQVGNPPWVRPDFDEEMALAESDVWWALQSKATQSAVQRKRARSLSNPTAAQKYVSGAVDIACMRSFVSACTEYPLLNGLRPDLYRCFMEQAWRHERTGGVVVLIHPETHFTDEKAGVLRQETYLRLRRHWQFVNELQLFENDHHVRYGVHVYGPRQQQPEFLMATALYHPSTVEGSFKNDGTGPEPGFKDDEGNWDTRPHRNRILHVDWEMLETWHAVLESDDVPLLQTRMVYAVNTAVAHVLDKLSRVPRLGELPLEFSAGWNETTDRQKGRFDVEWGRPESWNDVILQGPHIFVATPFYKQPNPTMKHNQDWSPVDLETLPADAIPITSYKPRGSRTDYDAAYTHWGENHEPARNHYRIAWRNMAANTGERTLIPAIIPPGAAHVHAVMDLGLPQDDSGRELLLTSAIMGSFIGDFMVRTMAPSTIARGLVALLPRSTGQQEVELWLILRTGRLNCVSGAYGPLWTNGVAAVTDGWTCHDNRCSTDLAVEGVPTKWTVETPLRREIDRRQALVEIDALVALMLGITADELCTIYRTQFAVLRGYDQNKYFYDARGRLVPQEVLKIWRQQGDRTSEEDRTATNASGNTYTYELPFQTYDREEDMRVAYAEFERRLQSEGE